MPGGFCLDDGAKLKQCQGNHDGSWECPVCGRLAPDISPRQASVDYDVGYIKTLVCNLCGNTSDWQYLSGDILECRNCKNRKSISMFRISRDFRYSREAKLWRHQGTIEIPKESQGIKKLAIDNSANRIGALTEDGHSVWVGEW